MSRTASPRPNSIKLSGKRETTRESTRSVRENYYGLTNIIYKHRADAVFLSRK